MYCSLLNHIMCANTYDYHILESTQTQIRFAFMSCDVTYCLASGALYWLICWYRSQQDVDTHESYRNMFDLFSLAGLVNCVFWVSSSWLFSLHIHTDQPTYITPLIRIVNGWKHVILITGLLSLDWSVATYKTWNWIAIPCRENSKSHLVKIRQIWELKLHQKRGSQQQILTWCLIYSLYINIYWK